MRLPWREWETAIWWHRWRCLALNCFFFYILHSDTWAHSYEPLTITKWLYYWDLSEYAIICSIKYALFNHSLDLNKGLWTIMNVLGDLKIAIIECYLLSFMSLNLKATSHFCQTFSKHNPWLIGGLFWSFKIGESVFKKIICQRQLIGVNVVSLVSSCHY